MRLLGLIPARGGSKRIADKNLQIVGGITLVARALQVAHECERLARVVVSSESEEILAEAAKVDERAPLQRPPALATDTSPIIDCLRDALNRLEGGGEEVFDGAVVLHPTSPLRLAADVDATVDLMYEAGTETAVSVTQVNHMVHPLKLKKMSGHLLEAYLEPEKGRRMAHELPPIFVRNCCVYVARRRSIDKNVLIDEDSCAGYVMPVERSVDINDRIDLEVARILLAERQPSAQTT